MKYKIETMKQRKKRVVTVENLLAQKSKEEEKAIFFPFARELK